MIATALRTLVFAAAIAYPCFAAEPTAAQEATDALYDSFTITPATPAGQAPRWQKEIVFYLHLLSDDRNSGDLLQDLLDDGRNDDVLFDSFFFYVRQLASNTSLDNRPTIDGNRAGLLIIEVENVEIPRRVDSRNQAAAFLRKGPNGERLCSLSVQWRDRAIQKAIIYVAGNVETAVAKRCVSEFIWRSFGFLGGSTSPTSWLDEALSEQQKVDFLKRLYARN
jgi:hypothetical protein